MGVLAEASQQAMPADNELRTGTVVQLTNPANGSADGIYVSFSPDPSAAPSRCFAVTTYGPVVGDVVQVLRQGNQFLILGIAGAQGGKFLPITLLANWVNYGGNEQTAQWRVVGDWVEVIGAIHNGTTTDGTVIANLGALVSHIQHHAANTSVNGSRSCQLVLSPNGNLNILGVGGGGDLTFTCRFYRGASN